MSWPLLVFRKKGTAEGTILSHPSDFSFSRRSLCQRNQKKNYRDKNNYSSGYQSDDLFSFFEFHYLPPVFRFVLELKPLILVPF